MKDALDIILDFTDSGENVYSPENDCFIFDEVYAAEDKSKNPLFYSEDEIKKSLNLRTQNYKITKNWIDSLPSDYLVLDLGCGRLTNSNLLKNSKAIYMDGAYFEGVNVVCDFAKKIPIKSASVDAILFSNVLEHVPEPQFLMKEISRILKEDGELLLLVPYSIKLHQTPFDFYRYTNFALEYLSDNSGLKVNEIRNVGGILNIIGVTLRIALQNEEKALNRFLLNLQYLVYRIQKKIFGEGEIVKEIPQGYALYATKKSTGLL